MTKKTILSATLIFLCTLIVLVIIGWEQRTVFIHEDIPTTKREMETFAYALVLYFKEFNEYPQGNNAEITQALAGKNPKQEIFIKPSQINKKQEFIDPWGNPYEIHLSPNGEFKIRTAGSNGVFYDNDDEFFETNLQEW